MRADLAEVAERSREASRTFADDLLLLARLAGRIRRRAGDERGPSDWTSFLREVAVARRCSDRAAAFEVSTAVDVVRRMPGTMELLRQGRLPVAQARVLVEELRHVEDAVAREVDALLAERACRLAPWRLRHEVKARLVALDADAAAVRAAQATALRDLVLTPLRDDQAELSLQGPALVLTAAYQAVDREARALLAAGDPRTLAQLRFDLAAQRIADLRLLSDRASGPTAPGVASDRATEPPSGAPGTCPVVAPPDASRPSEEPPPPPAPPDLRSWFGTPDDVADCRLSRPVQLLVHVPVDTALGLSQEPGWLDGYGWVSAPHVRQLLPLSELRQVCTARDGTVIDTAERVVRPRPSPEAVRQALLAFVEQPFAITDKTWRAEEQHDPSDALRAFVAARDRWCDGPTGSQVPAARCDADHERAHPHGPTAAWNLVSRARRSHGLKHRGWTPLRTATGTLWTSPAGQLVEVERDRLPVPNRDSGAALPDPVALHVLEAELLREPGPEDEPPVLPPF